MIYEAEEILVAKRGRGLRWTWLSEVGKVGIYSINLCIDFYLSEV
jgi:hypothetical protein